MARRRKVRGQTGPLGAVQVGDISKKHSDGRSARYPVDPCERALVWHQPQITGGIERTVPGYLPEGMNAQIRRNPATACFHIQFRQGH